MRNPFHQPVCPNCQTALGSHGSDQFSVNLTRQELRLLTAAIETSPEDRFSEELVFRLGQQRAEDEMGADRWRSLSSEERSEVTCYFEIGVADALARDGLRGFTTENTEDTEV